MNGLSWPDRVTLLRQAVSRVQEARRLIYEASDQGAQLVDSLMELHREVVRLQRDLETEIGVLEAAG